MKIPGILRGWLLSFAVFGVLALVFVGQFAMGGMPPPGGALRMAARDWLPWALLAPLIFLLVRHFPLERANWKITLPVHIVCAGVAVLIAVWWAEVVLYQPPDPSRPRPPGGVWFFSLAFRFPIYLAIVSIAHALHFYGRSQERERRSLGLEASLATARLEAMKMQLQPHFLFNSLNAIAELVHKQPEAAEKMLVALSHLLRLTLESSGEQELPLRRELEFVEHYLAIEQIRFGDRIQYESDVPIGIQGALVPAFLLQPLVENAVRHGLEPQSRAGHLKISASQQNGTLSISVADNGTGMSGKTMREGVGLGSTRARLHELHPGRFRMDLVDNKGFTVEIRLPFRVAS